MKTLLLLAILFLSTALKSIELKKAWELDVPGGIKSLQLSEDEKYLWVFSGAKTLIKISCNSGMILEDYSIPEGYNYYVNPNDHILTYIYDWGVYKYDLKKGVIVGNYSTYESKIDGFDVVFNDTRFMSSFECTYFLLWDGIIPHLGYINNNSTGNYVASIVADDNGNSVVASQRMECQPTSNYPEHNYFKNMIHIYRDSIFNQAIIINEGHTSAEIVESYPYKLQQSTNDIYLSEYHKVRRINTSNGTLSPSHGILYIPQLGTFVKSDSTSHLEFVLEGSLRTVGKIKDEHDIGKTGLINAGEVILSAYYSQLMGMRLKNDDYYLPPEFEEIIGLNSYLRMDKILVDGADFNWDFGDGTSSTDEMPKKKYNKEGRYIIEFNINSKNINETELDTVDVVANFSSSFDISKPVMHQGDSIELFSNFNYPHYEYKWLVGDSVVSTNSGVKVYLDKVGYNKITLQIKLRDSIVSSSNEMYVVATEASNIELLNEFMNKKWYNVTETPEGGNSSLVVQEYYENKIHNINKHKGNYYIDYYRSLDERRSYYSPQGGWESTEHYKTNQLIFFDSGNSYLLAGTDAMYSAGSKFLAYTFHRLDTSAHTVSYIDTTHKGVIYQTTSYNSKKYNLEISSDGYQNLVVDTIVYYYKKNSESIDIYEEMSGGLEKIKEIPLPRINWSSLAFSKVDSVTLISYLTQDSTIVVKSIDNNLTLSNDTKVFHNQDEFGIMIQFTTIDNGLKILYDKEGSIYEHRRRIGMEDGGPRISTPWIYDVTDRNLWIDGYFWEEKRIVSVNYNNIVTKEIAITDIEDNHIFSFILPKEFVKNGILVSDVDGEFYVRGDEYFAQFNSVYPLPEPIKLRVDNRKWDYTYLTVENNESKYEENEEYEAINPLTASYSDGTLTIFGLDGAGQSPHNAQVVVSDISGRLVFRGEMANGKVSLDLAQGQYLVRVGNRTAKLMVR